MTLRVDLREGRDRSGVELVDQEREYPVGATRQVLVLEVGIPVSYTHLTLPTKRIV